MKKSSRFAPFYPIAFSLITAVGCATTQTQEPQVSADAQNVPSLENQNHENTQNNDTHKSNAAEMQKNEILAETLFGDSELDAQLRESQKDAALMLFESWPDETTLDNDHIANVVPVWIEAIQQAKTSIDFEEFYAVNADENGAQIPATRALTRVIDAIKAATERGVKIRFIIDKKMSSGENAGLPEKLAQIPGVELRAISYDKIAGGVQHAKFFIVDGETAYFGSQNFDWRSLTQISEMGARVRGKELVRPLVDIYELDWMLAENPDQEISKTQCYSPTVLDYRGEATTVETVASPQKVLPCDQMWDLPKIIAMIDNAQKTIAFQLLNYATVNYDKSVFMELDKALTAAAARGVQVRMLVSDWSARPKYMADLKRLTNENANFEAKMIEIPEHSSGFVPYSRTIHSKFLVVDDDKTWLGTSNWSGDYFYNSRNVGIIATGKKLNEDLTKSFDRYWNSEYSIPMDPTKYYPVKDPKKPGNGEQLL